MATTNFTEYENHKTAFELSCTLEFTEGVHNELTFLLVLNIFLSITAFLEYSDPSCPTKRKFTSSAVQTPVL